MNSMESREMKYKNRKKHYRTNNHAYQRNQGYYSGSRSYTFNNSYSNNGIAGYSKSVYHSRSTRQYQHNRKDSTEYYTDYYWQQPRKTRREPSPLNGSEEYTLRKIQETSDMIKRQLMSPENTPVDSNRRVSEPIKKSTKVIKKSNRNSREPSALRHKLERKAALREKFNKTLPVQKSSDTTYNVKEIHNQILNHISKLNYGRKQNLINANSTGYDAAIQQIYKQKSLELSKALREMSHQEKPEASEVVNSIIPDFAIKFEELPIHVIRELSSTFEAFEKNIGNADISPYSFPTYSADQGLFQTAPIHDINSIPQEYLDRTYSTQITCNTNLSDIQNSIDDRVLHINSEDADSLVIKKENLIEKSIKIEDLEIIDIQDDDEETAANSSSTQINSILQLHEENNIPVDSNMEQSHSADITHIKIAADTSSDYETAVSSKTNAIIGTLRVSKNIFKNPNQQISIENEKEKQLTENLNENFNCSVANSSSNKSIPKLRINMNIFDEKNNYLSEVHSETQIDKSVEKSSNIDSSNDKIDDKSSNQKITNRIVSVGEQPNNSETTDEVMNNIVSSGGEPDFHSNVSRISSNQSEEKISSDNRYQNSTETQSLFKNNNYQNDHSIKQNCDSIIRSQRYFTRSASNTQQSNEENRNADGPFQGVIGTEIPNKVVSVTIKPFQKPKDIVQAAKIMMEIDSEIEKLTKLRQSLIMNLIGHKNLQALGACGAKRKKKKGSNFSSQRSKRIKRNNRRNQDRVICPSDSPIQLEDTCEEHSEVRIQQEDNILDSLEKQLEEKDETHQNNIDSQVTLVQSAQSDVQDFRNIEDLDINDLTGVPLICKIVHEKNSLIIGTDNGKVLYFNLCIPGKPFTVGISENAISCLEFAHVGKKPWIFTGTNVESQLRVIPYKKNSNRKNILLEDGIQSMQKEWQYCFIGGSRGFLTRYNWQKNKIEFEDKISEMAIMDLKATREGPRKILIILFNDKFGNKQIHVRDAMSALHIRTIGEIQTVNSLLMKNYSVFFSSNQEISVYSFCDGQFITKFTVPCQGTISLLHECGNLILAACSDGNIYAYNFRNMNLLGYFSCDSISSMVVFQEKVIFGSWSKTLRSLSIPDHILAAR